MAPRPPTERQVRLANSAKKSTAGRAAKRSAAGSRPKSQSGGSNGGDSAGAQKGYPAPAEAFSTTKRDKQSMKHSLLLHKIESSGVKKAKRRRPNKKLVTNLDTLIDALPEIGQEAGENAKPETEAAKRQRKAYGSRPGALKRRDKVEKEEREFVGKALAALSAGDPQASDNHTGPEGAETKWERIRKAIGMNMSNG
ncbi:hypothetical protein P152DRAFT_33493 [Eremomyces bilateralis CBS 781.70]|uniref:Ribosome biogenesis protein SLX9 n=1 Tax=Eremomyces bilateralis CBS 781.70 TaxID=1392243 RepID=A0A6G1G2W7_9PEZI|nr:uncharacterized protein P152DRAFT_33493 [Eremomyces bilateralis CBS 781.70]KAF1812358.1 hypothetical protein P152DRAFT_33493 [Eremomyces bilateralis CBS 781.70]